MIRSLLRSGFVSLKPRNLRKDVNFSEEQLNSCRELLSIGKPLECSIEENCAKYMQERAKAQVKVSPTKVMQMWEEIRPVQCEINVLSFSQTNSSVEQQYIESFVRYWGTFFLNNERIFDKDPFTYNIALKDFLKAFTNIIYLIKATEDTIFLFFKVVMLALRKKLIKKEDYFSPLRFAIEGMLELPKIGLGNLNFILYMTSTISPHLLYFEKEEMIQNFIYNQVPKNWTSFMDYRSVKNLIFNLSAQSDPPPHLTNQLPKLLRQTSNPLLKYQIFNFLLQFYKIDKTNIKNREYLQPLNHIISQVPNESMRSLAKLLYYADIWIPQFWKPYFNFMMINDNHKLVYNVDHIIIDQLLANGDGGQELQSIALKFREYLKGKGIDMEKLNFRDELEKIFGRSVNHKNSCQQNVANSLRLICGAQVLTEIPVKYFIVDILVNKKIVIEINNENHYKIVNGNKVLNLKSKFRERILQKQGFIYKNIRVEDYISSNYMMLEQVYNIIESCGDLKAKIPKPEQKSV